MISIKPFSPGTIRIYLEHEDLDGQFQSGPVSCATKLLWDLGVCSFTFDCTMKGSLHVQKLVCVVGDSICYHCFGTFTKHQISHIKLLYSKNLYFYLLFKQLHNIHTIDKKRIKKIKKKPHCVQIIIIATYIYAPFLPIFSFFWLQYTFSTNSPPIYPLGSTSYQTTKRIG